MLSLERAASFKSHVIGVLNCYTVKPHRFTPGEVRIIKSITSLAAIVIENFRLVVESQAIQEELESRKLIERAKGVLMKREGLTEQGAYKLIRKYSMDKRKTMKEVAEAILLSAEMQKFASSKE